MPNLPTLGTDNQVTWDRLMAAFGTAANYKEWLRGAVRAEVQSRELVVLQAEASDKMRARATELATFLDDAT